MTAKELVFPAGRTAFVCAHPDDETLWGGGLLARHRGFDVICCTIPYRDPERVLGFFKAMKLLGHHPFLLPFSEQSATATLTHLGFLELDGYDTVVTHNAKGEYGHPHHRQVHAHVCGHFTGTIYSFGYGLAEADVLLHLTDDERDRKLRALRCYDRQADTESRGGVSKSDAWLAMYKIDLSREPYVFGPAARSTGALAR